MSGGYNGQMTASRLKVPPATAQKLARLGIQLPMDLLLHLPLRHEDETRITPLASARDGQTGQIEGTRTA